MELNPQNTEKLSEQVRCSSSDDHGGPGPVRSYTCAFCKRGFSNAQALGGHMNIHRRDRAKLKQSSEENLLSLDISIKNPSSDHHEPHHPSSEEKILPQSCTIADHENDDKFAHGLQRSKVINVASELTQLPISGEIASIASNNNERIEEKKIEIDLELRLGPEPHEAPTLSTREFF